MTKIKKLCAVIGLFIVGQAVCKIVTIPYHRTSAPFRASSYPYISGDTFRAACDFIIDEEESTFNTNLVNDGDTIFLRTNMMSFFFKEIHPFIGKKYILVTHNSDCSAPGKFSNYLNDKKIIAWFGLNCDNNSNPKFIPIPIGNSNRYSPRGNIKLITEILQHIKNTNRPWLLYMNFTPSNNERSKVANLFSDKPWCVKSERKSFSKYLKDVIQAKFILCPLGAGLDCYRQWEAMLFGAIPIMKHSTIDPIFEGLPVLLVNEWSEVTEELLQKTYDRMENQSFKKDRMFAEYWLNKIETLKRSFSIKSKK